MVRGSPQAKKKPSPTWQPTKTITKAQVDKVVEESKNIAALATKKAIEAIQKQNELLDPSDPIPNDPSSIFESTPARTY